MLPQAMHEAQLSALWGIGEHVGWENLACSWPAKQVDTRMPAWHVLVGHRHTVTRHRAQ